MMMILSLRGGTQTDDGEDDMKKGTQLLEIYALEIQMYTAQKNNKKLKVSYLESIYSSEDIYLIYVFIVYISFISVFLKCYISFIYVLIYCYYYLYLFIEHFIYSVCEF